MMALKEGSQYGLLARDTVTAPKISCIQVKLTDAALKLIEDIKPGNRKALSTLEIKDEEGIIRIPNGRSSKDITFTVGPLPSDQTGSIDCIRLTRNGQLETLDSMTHKISVRATDEVYQSTREKVAVKKEESKKNCAKEIDQTKGGVKSKRVTKTIKNGTNATSRSNLQTNSKQTKDDWPPSLTSKSPNSLNSGNAYNNNSSPVPSSMAASQANTYSNPSNLVSSQTNAARMVDKLKRKQQSKLNSAAKEAAFARIKTSGPSKSDKEKTKAALLAIPLRERVVHTLGLKPNMYDTPQLLLKLRADGLNDSSSDVSQVLGRIGMTNSKGCWSLRPEHLSEVDVNWAFYSETDKQLVKRNLNRLGTSKPVVAVLPTSDTTKRKKDVRDEEDLPLSKQQKYNIDTNASLEDCTKHFTTVTNSDQRNRYKDEFNREYQEYKSLFEYVEDNNHKFNSLAVQLYAAEPDSNEYKKIEKKIRKKYKERSKEYHTNKLRLDYLQTKLAHIKRIVNDYDNATLKR
ncbi:RNA polymerase II elongation factor ELL2-like [Watersipora subatra]|uniref:RNA polymerase II elongation factor ELL2-like n=1 Tax=Watersipora subatra TaxID=2589382 RepID=UPI00355C8598